MRALTEENMRAFKYALQSRYNMTFYHPGRGSLRAILPLLKVMGVTDVTTWLKKWGITVGNKVWVPFVPGKGTVTERKLQIIHMCHELRHVQQWREDGVRFIWRYFWSKSGRANYESHALHTNLEMGKLLGMPQRPGPMADKLKYYLCRSTDIAVTKKHLEIYNLLVQRGGVHEEVSKFARQWWGL
jgi:hypothetical protein